MKSGHGWALTTHYNVHEAAAAQAGMLVEDL